MAAVLCTNAARHGASTWNSPVWPLLPLLLNRLTELLALGFGHVYLTVRGACCWLPIQAHSCPPRKYRSSALKQGLSFADKQKFLLQEAVASPNPSVSFRLLLFLPCCAMHVETLHWAPGRLSWPGCVGLANLPPRVQVWHHWD